MTLVARPKLQLNRNNNAYYQNHLVPLGNLPQRGFRASEQLLRKAFEWFDKRVAEHVRRSADQGRALAQFVEDASDKLFFTVITVTDELNAYKVFETLNARGVRLSATDLLKNHLFSVLDRQQHADHELASLEDRWEEMVGRLGAESFPEQVATLRRFGVRQPFSMLLAAHRRFEFADFEDILRACVVISLRYNVICGLSTGEQERVYGAAALRIARGEIGARREALIALKSIYPDDATFKAAFAGKVMRTTQARNKKVVRYLLGRIEEHVGGQATDVDSDVLDVEHVLPQHPGPGWDGFDDTEVPAMVHRLGNMTLLRRDANRAAGNGAYDEKRPLLQASGFAITRRLAEENAEWTAERVAAWQLWLAAQATAIWRISQLA